MVDYTKRRVLVIYTGGTIGMKRNPISDGWEPGDLESLKENIPQYKTLPYQIDFQNFYNKDGVLIDSSNANVEYYNSLAKTIEKEINNYNSIVVVFGTDTMAPSAGYLSYMLEGLKKPVIFTGAMKSVQEEGSDGPKNFIDALHLAGRSGLDIPPVNEVSIVFAGKIIRGSQAFKYDTKKPDAFRSQGYPLLGTIKDEEIQIDQNELKPELYENRKFKRHIISPDISFGNMGLTPMSDESFERLVKIYSPDDAMYFDGMAITPGSEKEKIFLENVPKDTPIFYVHDDKMPNDRFIKLEGIFDTQQALAKINYLLSLTRDQELLRKMCQGNLRGENKNDFINETELLGGELSNEKNNSFKMK